MTAILVVVCIIVLGGFSVLLHCLLSANDTAAERHDDLLEQLEALRQEAERKRVRREACADLRQHREGM